MVDISHVMDRPEVRAQLEASLRQAESRQKSNGAEDPRLKGKRCVGFRSLAEVRRDLKGTRYLVKPILETDSVAIWFGDSDTFKSFIALDVGLCVAHVGRRFCDLPTHHGAVFYVCGEGQGGIGRRVEAWHIHHRVDGDAPFFVSELPAALFDPKNAAALAEEIAALAEVHGVVPVLVFVDTLSTNMGDGDESKNPDVAKLLSNINVKVRARFHCAVVVIHHVGHGAKDRERGAYALRGNTDGRVLFRRMGGARTTALECQKTKDGPQWEPLAFEGRVVTLPGVFDSEGEPQTSLAFDPTEYVPPADKDGLPDKQASVLAVLQDMYRTQAATLAATGMDAAPRVAAKDWREKCATLGVVKDRRRFGEFKAKLVKKGTVREDQGFVYLVAQDAD